MEKLYMMETCQFQKEENGDWEVGILFNEGSGIILDQYGNKPEEIYDYKRGITNVNIPIGLFLLNEQQYLDKMKNKESFDGRKIKAIMDFNNASIGIKGMTNTVNIEKPQNTLKYIGIVKE